MENIKKIDIHAHATAFEKYYPRNIQKLVSVEEVIRFYAYSMLKREYFFL